MQTKRSVEIMAMNFKVFDNSQLVAEYAADILESNLTIILLQLQVFI